jgi:UDP-glucose 4-epimerase
MDNTTTEARGSIKNSKIFISGGAGYLGKNLIKKLYKDNEIIVYSRDEAKHYDLKLQYPNVKFIVGDVADFNRLSYALGGCHYAIFAASLKQISACDENPSEAIKTICNGAINSKNGVIANSVRKSVFISTDKACAATTIYGACKYVAEQSFIVKEPHENISPNRASLRYGNVTNSTGSIIRVLNNAVKTKTIIPLYSSDMTRFLIDVGDAVNMVEDCLLGVSSDGKCVVPMIKAFSVLDLFDLYAAKFGLQWVLKCPRVGEKIHETMICEEEMNRTSIIHLNDSKYLAIDPSRTYKNDDLKQIFVGNQFCSKDHVLSKGQLLNYLEHNEYFVNRT